MAIIWFGCTKQLKYAVMRAAWGAGIGLIAFIGFWVVLWSFYQGRSVELEMDVNELVEVKWLEHHWVYAIMHVFVVVPVLALSFDRKVHYYTYWKSLFPSIALVGAGFILWDAVFGAIGVWGFNDRYITGYRWWGLPWEECLFFFTVPFASFFIMLCLDAYFPKDSLRKWDKAITLVLAIVLLVVGLWFVHRLYTAVTFLLTGLFLVYHYIYVANTYRTRFFRAYLLILIPFLLSNGLLTGSFTEAPVVIYNPDEFMGIRIVTIPVEDAVYGFLLIFGITTLQQAILKKDQNKLGRIN